MKAKHLTCPSSRRHPTCIVIANANDRLSIVDSQGYVVVRREYRRREVNRHEVFHVRDLREVEPGLWIPFQQSRSLHQIESNGEISRDPFTKETLLVKQVLTGKLRSDQLEVQIPADVQEMEDHIDGVKLRRRDANQVPVLLQEVKEIHQRDERMRWIRGALLGALSLALVVVAFITWRRRANSCADG